MSTLKTPSPPRTAPHCRICSTLIRGNNHEICRLVGDNSFLQYRQGEDLDSKSSSASDASSSSNSSGRTLRGAMYAVRSLLSPPPTPTPEPSNMVNKLTLRFAELDASTDEAKERLRGPPHPVYPPSPLSDVSWQVPETGPYHHRNKRYVNPTPPPAQPSHAGPADPFELEALTEPVSDAITEFTENLRDPSPGPSAIAFMNKDDNESVGSSLTERMRSKNRMFPRPFTGQRQATIAPPADGAQAQDADIKPQGLPFWLPATANTPEEQYAYWPGNAGPSTPPANTRRRTGLQAFGSIRDFDMETVREVAENVIEPRIRSFGSYALQALLFFLVALVGGCASKYL